MRAGAPVFRRALDTFCSHSVTADEGLRCLLPAAVAGFLWDAEAWDVLTARLVQLARDTGALGVLTFALAIRATADRGGTGCRRNGRWRA